MSSPLSKWIKPTDIMRIHRLKRKSSVKKRTIGADTDSSNSNSKRLHNMNTCKRKNPFTCNSPTKRSTVQVEDKENSPTKLFSDDEDIVFSDSEPEISENSQHRLFQILNTADQKLQAKRSITDLQVLHDHTEDKNQFNISFHKNCLEKKTNHSSTPDTQLHFIDDRVSEKQLSKCDHLPVDWSLKVKLRIVSPLSPAFDNLLAKSSAEAKALIDFVHNTPLGEAKSEELLGSLQHCCNFWVHPSLPWFPAFPRIVSDYKIRKNIPIDIGQNEAIRQALYHDWMESFQSAFQQLKAGFCPYFYLCCHQFTVLFKGKGISGHSTLTACLTPTTRGIRESLKREGVDFSMPNLRTRSHKKDSFLRNQFEPDSVLDIENSQSQSGRKSSDQALEEASAELDADDEQGDFVALGECTSLWLEDMGLDRKSFPALEPNKVKIQSEGYQQVDRRAESLIFCHGCAVQALFNFLINCRSCIAMTGPQAGIPPTILSPTCFRGAIVQSNKIRHSVAKLSFGADTKVAHVLEISGPILPHHQLNVSSVLQKVVPVISYNTHEPTIALNIDVKSLKNCNCSHRAESAPSNQNWKYGLHSSVRDQLETDTGVGKGTALREVRCHPDGFIWSL